MQPEHFGDGLLMRNGFTLVWVGWEFDVARHSSVKPPIATKNGSPLVETIAALAVVDARATEASFSDVPLYPPVDLNDETATLTVRDTVWDEPTPLPRRSWQFVPPSRERRHGRCAGDAKCPRIAMASGFEPGRIYELKYRASNPPVSGVGLAAIRDVASAMKYGNGAIVPARGRYLHVYGASQSGRFLRLFLYDGFNADEKGRKVFDGVMPHIAGAGRADFNTRFSQAVGLDQFGALKFPVHRRGRNATRSRAAPTRCSAKYARRISQPKIIYTNSSVEYWGTGRAAALDSHVDRRQDRSDVAAERARVSLRRQRSTARRRSRRARRRRTAPTAAAPAQQLPQSDAAHDRFARAAFMALDRWVRDGVEPPASKYPQLSDGTLTPVATLEVAGASRRASPKLDPRAACARAVTVRQARGRSSCRRSMRTATRSAAFGLPDQAVPIGTLTGWNFRSPTTGNPTAIVPLLGSLIPFAKTAADRGSDPRKSLDERYHGKSDYLGRVTEAGLALVKQGYVLREDLPYPAGARGRRLGLGISAPSATRRNELQLR